MTLAFYLDDDVESRRFANELAKAGVDVLRATDAGNHAEADDVHLTYATLRERVLVTANRGDFTKLHSQWISEGRTHAGIVLVVQNLSVGERLRGLRALSAAASPDAMRSQLVYLRQWIER